MRTWWSACVLVALFVTPLAAAETRQTYESSHDFEVTSVSTPVTQVTSGTNCLFLGGPSDLHTVQATATWTAQTPLTATMELVFVAFTSNRMVWEEVRGASPLTLALTNVTLSDGDPAWLAVQTEDVAVAIEQAVTLDVVIDHTTAGDFKPSTGACAFG